MPESKCLICGSTLLECDYHPNNLYHCKCIRCGDYSIATDSGDWVKTCLGQSIKGDRNYFLSGNEDEYEKYTGALSAFVFEQSEKWIAENRYPIIDYEFINRFFHSGIIPWTPAEKVFCLLGYVNKHSKFYGDEVFVDKRTIYSYSDRELFSLVEELEKTGLVHSITICGTENYDGLEMIGVPIGKNVKITLKGLDYIKAKSENEKTNQCFVAMWFDDSVNDLFETAIRPACEAAGYKVVRIDKVLFNDDITDHIINEIQKSDFVIADLTGFRGGVYYEAGYARGLGKEVILCCQENYGIEIKYPDCEVCKKESGPHFDVSHINTIFWDKNNLEEFKQKLTERIIGTVRRGNNQNTND